MPTLDYQSAETSKQKPRVKFDKRATWAYVIALGIIAGALWLWWGVVLPLLFPNPRP